MSRRQQSTNSPQPITHATYRGSISGAPFRGQQPRRQQQHLPGGHSRGRPLHLAPLTAGSAAAPARRRAGRAGHPGRGSAQRRSRRAPPAAGGGRNRPGTAGRPRRLPARLKMARQTESARPCRAPEAEALPSAQRRGSRGGPALCAGSRALRGRPARSPAAVGYFWKLPAPPLPALRRQRSGQVTPFPARGPSGRAPPGSHRALAAPPPPAGTAHRWSHRGSRSCTISSASGRRPKLSILVLR